MLATCPSKTFWNISCQTLVKLWPKQCQHSCVCEDVEKAWCPLQLQIQLTCQSWTFHTADFEISQVDKTMDVFWDRLHKDRIMFFRFLVKQKPQYLSICNKSYDKLHESRLWISASEIWMSPATFFSEKHMRQVMPISPVGSWGSRWVKIEFRLMVQAWCGIIDGENYIL